ncbi:UDP-N-acetylglucosamine 1-carboxyvinyltransferase [Deinobacterium chartae]|uniref:UDP-N-acetylglucosamine 1-carboxyvinyltransferase n=1 Tax=Deinobacterium chartae TaxID=521158 RepID=A0A841HX53_9DEIO|nr:UDP-N-acetylglucosamine 1-carboxyvinyltransferase [Deinobacterium chartae]MBB6097224.1 UDP-N-acetylglucosamine 1-carboxyvinyltransferase [Deinobacterium chartae]
MLNATPLHIIGGVPLEGEYKVQPSKNAALPIIVASLLSAEPITLHGIPRLADIFTILEIVAGLGTRHAWVGPNSLTLHTPEFCSTEAPYSLVSKMRASFIVMGPLLARAGEAQVSMPGGCAFGHRPVDQHIKAFRAMGVEISEEGGNFYGRRSGTPSGSYVFEMLTVGATQNAILAATLGEGTVTLENCSIDTDVVDMITFLNSLGANIQGAGTNTITVHGVKSLRGGEYTVIPDRLDAGTMMIAATATRSRLILTNVNPGHLRAVSAKLTEIGAHILEMDGSTMLVDARGAELRPANVTALEFPGFPTDLQPQIGALLATVPGTSLVVDKVYPDRNTHVTELQRMGAHIEMPDRTMVFQGTALHGAPVRAADIRAGAALVVAALTAHGETVIDGMQYLNRGYENLAARLREVSAQVQHLEPAMAMAMD